MRTRLVVPVLVAALFTAGCLYQDPDANDNGPQPQPDRPSGVVRPPGVETPAS